MYQFGENQPHRVDFRPEVHDSDGLMVATGDGEWLWRPLINPRADADHVVLDARPQRLRLDAARSQLHELRGYRSALRARPSAWVEPTSSWGPGRVELVQIYTPNETNDNIVAYWVPDN